MTSRHGTFVYLDFEEVGEPWHEALVGKQAGPGRYVIQTPDGDEYVQDFMLSADVRGVRWGSPTWVLPPGIGARHGFPVYRFSTKPTKADVDAFLGRCDAVIAAWKLENAADLSAMDIVVPADSPAVDPPGDADVNAGDAVTPKVYGFASMDFTSNDWVNVLGAGWFP